MFNLIENLNEMVAQQTRLTSNKHKHKQMLNAEC